MNKYTDTPESRLVSYLINYYQDKVDGEDSNYDQLTVVEPEAHYNYYGDRGVADLYIEAEESINGRTVKEGIVYEVKSEHAVKQANGAGDIIRQFNRMARYFFQDETWSHPGYVTYELAFIPTPATIQHVEENKALYKQVDDIDQNKSVVFRAPEAPRRAGLPFVQMVDTVGESLAYSAGDEFARAAGVDQDAISRGLEQLPE